MFNTRQTQGSDGRLTPSIRPVSRLIRHSPVPLLPARNLKLNPSLITNYTSRNTSLMLAVKGSNKGKHVARRRKTLLVEEGRGE